jgi:uncharacterized protein involved in outer membrane biogenesis
MGKVIKIVASLAAVIFIAAFYALLNIDLNDYKQQIQDATADATGRQLQLEGDVSIAWSLIPTLVIEKATFSNVSWGTAPEMVSLDKFEVRLALYPLLKREIQVTKVLLDGPQILVETNKEGVGNWVFDVVSEPEAESEELGEDETSGIQSVIVNELDITRAKIDYIDGHTGEKKQFLIEHLSIDVADLETPIDLLLKAVVDDIPVSVDGEMGGLKALMDNTNALLDLKANAGGIALDLDGDIAQPLDGKGAVLKVAVNSTDTALSKLSGETLPAFGNVTIKGDVKSDEVTDKITLDLLTAIDGLDLVIKGQVVKPQEGKGVSLDIDLKTDSSTLSLLSGSEIPEIGQVELKGQLSNHLKTEAVALDLTALAEALKLTVKGDVLRPQQADGITLNLNLVTNSSALSVLAGDTLPPISDIKLSSVLTGNDNVYKLSNLTLIADKTDLSGDVAVSLAGDKPKIKATLASQILDLTVLEQSESSSEPEPTSDRLFSDEPMVFNALNQLDADVTLKVQSVDSNALKLRDVDVAVGLKDSHLKVSPLDLSFAGSRLTGNVDLNAKRETATLSTKMQVNGFKLAKVDALKEVISGGNTDVYIGAKGRGKTVRQLMAGLNGKAIIKVGESQIEDGTLDLLGGDFITELASLLNPFSKEKKGTELACAVVNFNIKDGIATADKGIAVRTGKMNIVGDGTINLKNEKLDIGITPEARTGIGMNMADLVGLVRVGGTLAAPSALVDKAAVLEAGLATGAAVATGGLSVVAEGLIDRATADENPCQTALGVKVAAP